MNNELPKGTSRRQFMQNSGAAVFGGVLASEAGIARGAHPTGGEEIRLGLVGCGGRGSGAARQAVNAGENIKLVAMADVFGDRLQASRRALEQRIADKMDVPLERCFTGFDGYKELLASDVDLVLLATPPHFRPAHIRAAMDAGKHIFAEKPVAVDAPGVRSVLASCRDAKNKGLAIVSGLCWRYHPGVRETIQRVHDGAIGRIVALQCNYNTTTLWMKPRQKEWSDMEWQLRNWLYFTWLSGDHNVEQHIHSLDKMPWAMQGEYPVKASGTGGRQVRVEPEFGHIFDHHAVIYEFASGVRAFSHCRQMTGCDNDVSDHIFGTKGTCNIMKHTISSPTGETMWRYRGRRHNMYQIEHDELIASIRSGNPINNGQYMSKSTMMAIMGRMATYTGKTITWDEALNSREDLTPPKYEFGPLPLPPVAKPGLTPFG